MTVIDNGTDARVAQTPLNGRPVEQAGGVLKPTPRDGSHVPPAMIENVAERPTRRSLGQVLSDRRTARAAKREAALATDDGMNGAGWFRALIASCLGVVLVTFLLSYHGLFEFGQKIAHQPDPLPLLVPLGVDALSLVALFATFLTHDAGLKVRAYCWLLFGFTVAVSVAGNAVFAIFEVDRLYREAGLNPASQKWDYEQYSHVAGAALWPMFAAAALHLLIIARRHLTAKRRKARLEAENARMDAENGEQAATTDALNKLRAIEMVIDGATCSAIADDLGVPRRNVERWTQPIRAALDAKTTTETAKPAAKRATRATA